MIAFTDRLLPTDRAALGTFGHTVSLVPTLTGDRAALVGHLGDDVPFPAGTALWDAIEAGRLALADEGGRRVILVVTDAADNCSRTDLVRLRNDLERDGILLYAIGIRGRQGLSPGELGAMARRTGGWYTELRSSDDVGTTMQGIVDELHRQYVFAFTPQVLDDKVHRIEVKVVRPGLTVRARARVCREERWTFALTCACRACAHLRDGERRARDCPPAGQRPISASPQATFSTKTEAVYVAATVIDKDGRLVTGLTKSDFEIREAGATREITVFRNDNVPFAIAVMLDVSGSMVVNLGLMRRAVEQLVSRFEPGDRAAIGTFQGLPMITRDFTANPARLMEGVSGAMGGMGSPCGTGIRRS